jgi:hypothetical protein
MVYNLIYGTFSVYPSVLAEITGKYGFDSDDKSSFGVAFYKWGIGGNIMVGSILDKKHNYKQMI